ncbi:MAG: xanthine dehydrogenase family protein subunit M [Clostridiales bacterium]|jgi:CO/xanthine dehydrogenase FAD-binding subunit|nr:xanthine dehydrogenase family protein subunit M [Clostridiales bacterium]
MRIVYEKPATLEELFSLMKLLPEGPGVKLLAGGTDLLPQLRAGRSGPEAKERPILIIADIKRIQEFNGIHETDKGLFIGAAETMRAVAEHPLVRRYQALAEGAGRMGCLEIQNRATIGGNICNGSPSADSLPGLLVYDAKAVIISEAPDGTAPRERTMPLERFLLGPGKVDLRPGEALRAVVLPRPPENSQSRYYRRTRVKGMDLSGINAAIYCESPEPKAGAAAWPAACGLTGFRIAFGAVWPTVARARMAEDILNSEPVTRQSFERAAEAVLADMKPRESSMRATPDYKRAMIPVLIEMGISEMGGASD